MIEMEFSIWLASKTRWVHLTKAISLPVVPRVGEHIKFKSKELGDYYPWKVTQVTYRESGVIEVWTELLEDINGRGYSFEEEDDFDEYHNAYIEEGWQAPHGIKRNTKYRGGTSA
ncbi:hypothetical protein [Pontibacterium sp.]|uniref:hypothetical protein n=1 Tax=Pontibacterium sp. TaxID=2036026 RepID=UPI003567209C